MRDLSIAIPKQMEQGGIVFLQAGRQIVQIRCRVEDERGGGLIRCREERYELSRIASAGSEIGLIVGRSRNSTSSQKKKNQKTKHQKKKHRDRPFDPEREEPEA